jgi:hypothetical protein
MGRKFSNNIMVAIHDGKISLAIHRRGWVDNIKMDLRERECDGVNWIQLARSKDKWRDPGKTATYLWGP